MTHKQRKEDLQRHILSQVQDGWQVKTYKIEEYNKLVAKEREESTMKRTLQEWADFIGLPVERLTINIAVVLCEDEDFIKFIIPRDLWAEGEEV